MAVAADFHRNFLTPERLKEPPDNEYRDIQMNCAYSFVELIISRKIAFFKYMRIYNPKKGNIFYLRYRVLILRQHRHKFRLL